MLTCGRLYLLQIRCDAEIWKTVSSLEKRAGVCNFQPFTNVTCELRAANSAGNSARVSRTVTTQCDGKNMFFNVSINLCLTNSVKVCLKEDFDSSSKF